MDDLATLDEESFYRFMRQTSDFNKFIKMACKQCDAKMCIVALKNKYWWPIGEFNYLMNCKTGEQQRIVNLIGEIFFNTQDIMSNMNGPGYSKMRLFLQRRRFVKNEV
jgi:hypothetical protein